MKPSAPLLVSALFALAGIMIGTSLGPWWLHASLGFVNFALLLALRSTLRDHLLAVSLGVDVVIRDQNADPKVLRVRRDETVRFSSPNEGDPCPMCGHPLKVTPGMYSLGGRMFSGLTCTSCGGMGSSLAVPYVEERQP